MNKGKVSKISKAKRLIARMSRAELKDLKASVYRRERKIREEEIDATCAAGMAKAEGFLADDVPVMIDPDRVGVSGSGIIPGAKLHVRKVHRGSKHRGVWVSPERTSLSKFWRWVREYESADLVPYVEDPKKLAASTDLVSKMNEVFGSTDARSAPGVNDGAT